MGASNVKASTGALRWEKLKNLFLSCSQRQTLVKAVEAAMGACKWLSLRPASAIATPAVCEHVCERRQSLHGCVPMTSASLSSTLPHMRLALGEADEPLPHLLPMPDARERHRSRHGCLQCHSFHRCLALGEAEKPLPQLLPAPDACENRRSRHGCLQVVEPAASFRHCHSRSV